MNHPGVSGSWTTELRQPGTNAVREGEEVGPCGSRSVALRQHSRPRRFDWPRHVPGIFLEQSWNQERRPRGCPRVELDFRTETASRSVISSFCLADVGHARVSEARQLKRRSRQAQATGGLALTSENCLVQSRTDTSERKVAVQSKGTSHSVPVVTTSRRQKSSTGMVRRLTFEAIELFEPAAHRF
jgi:hypothetical protein